MASIRIHELARHRPGGRTARTTSRIHAAVLDVLVNEGLEACAFSRIAAVAGVQRSTLYRRFSDRWDMIMQAYLASVANEVAVDPTGDFVADMRMLLTRFVDNLSRPIGQALMTVVLAIRGTPAEIHIDRFMKVRLAQIEPIFSAAIATGTIDPAIDRREVIERAAGAAIFRLFIEGLPIDEAWIERMTRALGQLYSTPIEETPS